ncbi:cytidylate kinase family protein [Candidatus Pacearchaeota archaeon]|nr:cytidylate kinase family protein [Candidatus Pacearchaeota archaeon]
MKITIAGQNGSGKSTVAKFLAKKFKLKHYSAGDLRGQIAMKMGITIDELNRLGEKEFWTDKIIDEYQRELGKKEDNFVIDGRLSFYFIPDSIKIFLRVDPQVGAERIFKNPRPDEEKKNSAAEIKKMITERYKRDIARYKKYYHVNIEDLSNYDIIIDTTKLSEKEVGEAIIKAIKKIQKDF